MRFSHIIYVLFFLHFPFKALSKVNHSSHYYGTVFFQMDGLSSGFSGDTGIETQMDSKLRTRVLVNKVLSQTLSHIMASFEKKFQGGKAFVFHIPNLEANLLTVMENQLRDRALINGVFFEWNDKYDYLHDLLPAALAEASSLGIDRYMEESLHILGVTDQDI